MPVRLQMLGGLAVHLSPGNVKQVQLDRPASLLVYLAVRNDWVLRSDLATLYRPDSTDEEAQTYLRKLLFRARRYPWASQIEVQGGHLRWLVKSDVNDVLTAARLGQWNTVYQAYAGPLLGSATVKGLPGFSYWHDLERQALHGLWAESARNLAEQSMQAANPSAAANYLERLIDNNPLDEESVQKLMQALAADGRTPQAIAAFRKFERTLTDELAISPLESTQVLAESIDRQASSLRTAASPLPEHLTGFVGRHRELADLARAFQAGERLVTVAGLGGSGKTRLAVQAARDYMHMHSDSVHFVSVESLANPADLLPHIAEALAVVSKGDPLAALAGALRGRHTLLVIDNFETVAAAAAGLARLLEALPTLKLLVTSRQALNVSGEWLYELGGLTLPGDASQTAADSDALQLMVDRATRYAPRFTPTEAALNALAQICTQLEGMPLALELAASWLRVLPAHELLSLLASQGSLLTTDLKDIPERHKSIWRVFDHTWAHLSEPEAHMLVKLVVFRGGFTLDAARQVAQADLQTLLGLVNRQLVRRRSEGRFAIHELVRQYVTARADTPTIAAAQSAHSGYYCQLLGGLQPNMMGQGLSDTLQVIADDIANVEAAWHTAVEAGNLAALEMARHVLDHYIYYRGRYDLARSVFEPAIEKVQQAALHHSEDTGTALRLRGLLQAHLAEKQFGIGEFAAATALAQSAVQALNQYGSTADVATAKLVLANGLVRSGRYAEARQMFEWVLEQNCLSHNPVITGAGHNGLANVLSLADGDIALAEKHYLISLQASRQAGDIQGVSGALTNLGACRYDVGDLEGAERYWEQAVDATTAVGLEERQAALFNNLGSLAERRGDLDLASQRLERSLDLRRQLGNRSGAANVLISLGRLAVRRNETETALGHLHNALSLHSDLDDLPGETQCRSYLSRVLVSAGRADEASAHLQRAVELAMGSGSQIDVLGVAFSGALLLKACGRGATALSAARTISELAAHISEALTTEAQDLARNLAQDSAADEAKPAALEPGILKLLQRLQSNWNAAGTGNH